MISVWEEAPAPAPEDACPHPLDHSGTVLDAETIHTIIQGLQEEDADLPDVGVFMLWQPEGSSFLARPGVVIGSLTFGQTFAIEKAFVEPRHAIALLEDGGEKRCVCNVGSRPDLRNEIVSLGLRKLEEMKVTEAREKKREQRRKKGKERQKAREDGEMEEEVNQVGGANDEEEKDAEEADAEVGQEEMEGIEQEEEGGMEGVEQEEEGRGGGAMGEDVEMAG